MRRLAELTIQSKPDQIDKVTDFIANCGARLGLKKRKILDAQICADEACSNAIAYAYPDAVGAIRIVCESDTARLLITVADDGVPFDPLAIPEPDLTSDLELRSVGGLGIHLIRTLMDEVRYRRDGESNVLVMTKNL